MGIGKLLPRSFKRKLLTPARSFVARAEVRGLLEELQGGARPDERVSGAQVELFRSLATIRASLPRMPGVLVDIGAHQGAFSAAAVPCLGFERVICFEPDSDLNEQLWRQLPQGKCVVHNVALSSRAGRMEFHVHPVKAMNSLLASDAEVIRSKFKYDPDQVVRRDVEVETLDGALSREKACETSRFFLKIDTQGNEMDVLEGARQTLKRTDGCLIEFMFCTPYARTRHFPDLVAFMNDAGFDCHGALTVMRRPSHEVSGVDFLFVRRAHGTDEDCGGVPASRDGRTDGICYAAELQRA